MMWWDGERMGVGGWLLMGVLMIVVLGALIALAVWIVRTGRTDPNVALGARRDAANSHDVLAQRFAAGEIDEDDFKHRRELLRSTDDLGS